MSAIGQESKDSVYYIKTVESEVLRGKLVYISPDTVVIQNRLLGIVKIARTEIKYMDIDQIDNITKTYSTEPYYVPTGYTGGAGNHYYRNYFLAGNDFHFGASDRIDLSFGIELASILTGSQVLPIIQFGAKFAGPIGEKLNIGIATKILANDEGGIGIVFVPFTLGGRRTNVTFSPGLAKEIGGDGIIFFPTVNVSLGLGKYVRLIADGVYADELLIVTPLFELDVKGKFALLLGAAISNEFAVPNFGFSIPFGR